MTKINPYVGPKPLAKGDPIFGREQELRELRYLLTSERIVLLHSPSGAGKSSLVNAKGGLGDQLRTRFDVWLPTRVSQSPNITVKNRYVWSAVVGFEHELPDALQRKPEQLADATLKDYVTNRPRRKGAPANVLLIFDQFEEILRVDPLNMKEKREFFSQLGEMLVDPTVWALFVLREDYLAPLDPYVRSVPTHLQQRYRIDLLRQDQAREAMMKLAKKGDRDFTPKAVDCLLADLAAVNVQNDAGEFVKQKGEFVEPLQMQVVCHNLWDRMPPSKKSIGPEHVKKFGNVNAALKDYYADSVQSIGEGDRGVEWTVRQWVRKKLITPDGIRNQARRGANQSEGLDNARVQMLVDAHLVRGEKRGGATWYELAHDRLVDPILSNNDQWSEEHLSTVEKRANLWKIERTGDLLFVGDKLKEAKAWEKENRPVVDPVDLQNFLAACEDKEAGFQKDRRQARRLRWLAIVSTAVSVVAVIAFITAGFAYIKSEESLKSEQATKKFAKDTLTGLSDAMPEEIEALMKQVAGALSTDETQDADKLSLQRARMFIKMGRFFYNRWDRTNSRFYLKKADEKLDKLSSAGIDYPEALLLRAESQEIAGDLDALHPVSLLNAEQSYLSALKQYSKVEKHWAARVSLKLVTLYMIMVNQYEISPTNQLDLDLNQTNCAATDLKDARQDKEEAAAHSHTACAATYLKDAHRLIDTSDKEEAYSERATLNDIMAMKAMREENFTAAQLLLKEAVELDRKVIDHLMQEKEPFHNAKSAQGARLQHLGDTLRLSDSGDPSPFYAEAETLAIEILSAYPNQNETYFMLDLIRYGQSLADDSKGLVKASPAEHIAMKESALDRDFGQGFGPYELNMSFAKVNSLLDSPFKLDPNVPVPLSRALEYLTGDVRYFFVPIIDQRSYFRDFYNLPNKCLDDGSKDQIVFLFHEDSLIRISYRLAPPKKGPKEDAHKFCDEKRENLFPNLAERYEMPLFGTPEQWRLQWDNKQVSIIGTTTGDYIKLDVMAR